MTSTFTNPALTAALAAATGDPRRYVITGGPSSGKDDLIAAIHAAGIPCMAEEPGREIYRKHRERLGRHLRREDRRDYSLEVLEVFVAEYTAHKHGVRFYNRGIPDGYGWDAFFGLRPTPQLEETTRLYRYDAIFVLDQQTYFHALGKDGIGELIERYYRAFFDSVSEATDTGYAVETYTDQQASPGFRAEFLRTLERLEDIRWWMAPSHGVVHIRIPCPDCGWAEKRADRTKLAHLDEDGATVTAVCFDPGGYEAHIDPEDDQPYLDLATLDRNPDRR